MTVWESRTPPDIHCERAPTRETGRGSFAFAVRLLGRTSDERLPDEQPQPSNHNEWSQTQCLITSLPVALARMTLVEVPQPGALIRAVTVVVGVQVANDAVARTGRGLRVTNGVPLTRVRAGVTAEVTGQVRGRSEARTGVLEARTIAGARGVVRC